MFGIDKYKERKAKALRYEKLRKTAKEEGFSVENMMFSRDYEHENSKNLRGKQDFEKLIHSFEGTGDYVFEENLGLIVDGEPTLLTKVKTNKGIVYIFEIDYISNFQTDVVDYVQNIIGTEYNPVKLESYTELKNTSQYKSADIFRIPKDWNTKTKFYANPEYSFRVYDFNFLFVFNESPTQI